MIHIKVDASFKDNKAFIGVYIKNKSNTLHNRFILKAENSAHAELLAIKQGMKMVVKKKYKGARIYTDNESVYKIINGESNTKKDYLLKEIKYIKTNQEIYNINIMWIKRKHNKEADIISNKKRRLQYASRTV